MYGYIRINGEYVSESSIIKERMKQVQEVKKVEVKKEEVIDEMTILKEEYKSLFGKYPSSKYKLETIKSKIEETRKA